MYVGQSKIISVSSGFYVTVGDDAKFANSSHFVFQWYYASLEEICCVFSCVKCTGNVVFFKLFNACLFQDGCLCGVGCFIYI